MLQETLGRFGESMEEDVYRRVDLVIELTCGGSVEETVE